LSNYVPGEGPASANLMIVGEAPGAQEELSVHPFVGRSGEIVNKLLSEIGSDRRLCYVTNCYKYRPPDNDIKRIAEVCDPIKNVDQLWEEINAIRPNAILALGNTALEILTGKSKILKWRGSILTASRKSSTKVIPTIHPASVMYPHGSNESANYTALAFIKMDFERAWLESQYIDLRLPYRVLRVSRHSGELYGFLQQNRHKKLVSVDIEVARAIPTCVSLAFSQHEALSVPLINAFPGQCFPHQDLVETWKLLAEFFRQPDLQVIGQNFKFDHQKLEQMGFLIRNVYADTMLMAHTCHAELPKSLQFLTSIYTREPYYKDEGREFDLQRDSPDRMYLYNAKDAAVTYEVYLQLEALLEQLNLKDFFYSYVMKLHPLYMDIERVGFKVDQDKLTELIKKYTDLCGKLLQRMQSAVTMSLNPNSPAQIKCALKELGFPERKGTGEDEIIALLANHGNSEKKTQFLNDILDYRKSAKTLSTYLLSEADFDGRIRTSYNICGTETGRSSTSKTKPPTRPYQCGLSYHNITKHGEIGADIRKYLTCESGSSLLEVDLSQAEARVVAMLADDHETLQLFETTDIHKLTASWIFGLPMDKITGDQRFIGKGCRHAGNYGMRKKRFMEKVHSDAKTAGIKIELSEYQADKILTIFHRRTPKIQGVFHPSVESCLRHGRWLVNPFGRSRLFYERWGEELFREAYANIPQSTVIDHLRYAALRIKGQEPDLKIVVEAHDAITCIVKDEDIPRIAKIIVDELEKPISFAQCSIKRGNLVIPAEVKVGKNYKDLVKYEIP
jgi:uracil-DNA glycosylase family 4